jgi:hypothetical protein
MPPNSPPQSLDDLLTWAERYAQDSLQHRGHVPGTVLMLGSSGPGIYVPSQLDSESARNRFAETARHVAVAHDATAVVMVLEAWARRAVPGLPFDPTVPPSQAPDRQEVVALIGEAAGVQQVRFLPLQRGALGTFAGFGPAQTLTGDRAEGRFAGILPAHPPTPAERARARAFLQAEGTRQTVAAARKSTGPRHWH